MFAGIHLASRFEINFFAQLTGFYHDMNSRTFAVREHKLALYR